MTTVMDAAPGEAISTHNAENVFSGGLPWKVISLSRMPAAAVVAMIRALREQYGMSSSVSNRVYYAVGEHEDGAASDQRAVAYTYDDQGFVAVVSPLAPVQDAPAHSDPEAKLRRALKRRVTIGHGWHGNPDNHTLQATIFFNDFDPRKLIEWGQSGSNDIGRFSDALLDRLISIDGS